MKSQLQDKPERIYVVPGSDAESYVARRFPHKTVKRVSSGIRPLILRFRARVGKKELEGCHFLNTNEKGQIQEITTMMCPLDVVTAFYEGMEACRLRQLRENTQ